MVSSGSNGLDWMAVWFRGVEGRAPQSLFFFSDTPLVTLLRQSSAGRR
jgi:hypothetical protein